MRLLVYEYCCVQSDADPAGLALLHEGWGMLRALVDDLSRAGHSLVVLASAALEPRLRRFPDVVVEPALPENDSELLALRAPQVDACLIVAPEFRGILRDRVQVVREAGGLALNCTPECIDLTTNKLAIREHFETAEWNPVSFPGSVRWDPEALWEQCHYPLVLKPIDGAGSQATFRVDNAEELARAATQAQAEGWHDLLVQPYHAGVAASVCWLAGKHPLMCPPTEQILSADGRFHYRGARYPLESSLWDRAWKLASELNTFNCPGLLGWVGVDICLAPYSSAHFPTDLFFDINPRLTTSYLALRQRCAGNLADALVRVALGEEVHLGWDWSPLEFSVE